jgi:hypothetical protein
MINIQICTQFKKSSLFHFFPRFSRQPKNLFSLGKKGEWHTTFAAKKRRGVAFGELAKNARFEAASSSHGKLLLKY